MDKEIIGLVHESTGKKAEKILRATIKLFLRGGVRKVTMDDIAENANASKVTVYKYFKDKDALYLEISKYIFSRYTVQLDSVIASDYTFTGKLYKYLDVICDFTDSGQYDLCRELSKYNHEIEAESDLYRETYKHTLLALIDEGIGRGLMNAAWNRDAIYHYINMGVLYYQQDAEYRSKMQNDPGFRQKFMLFYINTIFNDASRLLSSR